MNINDFGKRTFITWIPSLIERVKTAEREERLRRALRRMSMPRVKRHRLEQRYFRWLTRHLSEPVEDIEGYNFRRALQIHLKKE